MKYSIILLFTLILSQLSVYCQTRVKVDKVDFHSEGGIVVINYAIVGSLPKEHMTIELSFKAENGTIITPLNVTGDIGTGFFGDGIKTIRWDVVADQISISNKPLKAVVTITSSKLLYGGPSNALLSAVIPGLGGYFVDKNKIRSIATAVGTLGLVGYGITQKHRSDKFYKEYNEINSSDQQTEIENLYNKANSAHHKYFISTRVAAGLWAFDIVWVVIKGIQNKKEYKSFYRASAMDGLRLNYASTGLQLKYSVSF